MKILLTVIMLCLSINSFAADKIKLQPILVDPEKNVQIFLDTKSIGRVGSVIRYQLHMLFTPSHQAPFEENGVRHEFTEPVSKVIDTLELACEERTFISSKKEFYGFDNNLLWTYESADSEPEQVNLENISGVLWQVLCRGARPSGPAKNKQST